MDTLYKYISEHSTPQTEALEWIEKQTHIRTNHARMLTGPVQGRFLKMLAGALSPAPLPDTLPYALRWLCLKTGTWTPLK